MKIVNLDGYTTNPGDLSWDWLYEYGDVEIYDRTNPEDVYDRAKDADILFINKTPIDKDMLKRLSKLKYVGLQSTGYNIIDCDAAKNNGVIVTNIPEYSTSAVAQLTFALILELTNAVGVHSSSVYNNEWCNSKDFCYWKTNLTELDGKTIGIIGYGKIGQRVAKIADSFGMNVLAYSPSQQINSIDEILCNSDIITLHCPLNPNTEKLINNETIKKMKSNAIIINTSRGPVIDEQALANALNNGMIAGAGLDVLSVEPCTKDNPLLKAKNCYITPHIAWAGFETRARLIKILQENFVSYLNGSPQNVVNK